MVSVVSLAPRRLEGGLGVLSVEDADESTVGICDHDRRHRSLTHAGGEAFEVVVGPGGGRSLLHDLLDGCRRVGCECVTAEAAENDPLVVDHQQTLAPAAVALAAASATRSPGPHVSTSRRATVPALRVAASGPSVGSPAASQSVLPGAYR